jgi:phage terminase large subunit GpA-like protein
MTPGGDYGYHPALLELMKCFAPKERPAMAAWAEEHFRLSSSYSAETNLITLDPFQVEPCNAFSDPRVRQITLMSSTQLFKTLLMQIGMAWGVVNDPGPMLFVGFKDSDVEKFSKERFSPMMHDIEPLAAVSIPLKGRESGNTIDQKLFTNGASIDFVGSGSPANLARRTIKFLFCDEVDKWEVDRREGEPLDLARARLARYFNRSKLVVACSPTLEGSSRIAAEFEQSDQRYPYVACPFCQEMQILRWHNVKFDSDLPPREAGAGARIICTSCKQPWTDQQRRWACKHTHQWRAHRPFEGHAGFWISHLNSTLPVHSLEEMVVDWLRVKDDPTKRIVFKNTRLAELYTLDGERPDHTSLRDRAEPYHIRGVDLVLPEGAEAIVAGADVQARRIEVQTLGIGLIDGNLHIWVVDYNTIELLDHNNISTVTSAAAYWTEMKRLLHRTYRTPSGVRLPILAMAVDCAHQAEEVYKFSQSENRPLHSQVGVLINSPRTVVCIRGYDTEAMTPIHGVSDRESARMRKGAGQDIPIVTLGTGYLKTALYGALQSPTSSWRIHFSEDLSPDYYRGLASERQIVSNGKIKWDPVYPRNEPLDTFVYGMGAMYLLRIDRWPQADWNTYRRKFGLSSEKAPAVASQSFQSPYISDK